MSHFDAKQYWDRRLKEGKGLLGVGHAALGEQYNRWLYRIRRAAFRRCVRKLGLDARQSRTLDVGSGSGFYINCWEELGATHITGSDLTAVAVENLAGRWPQHEFVVLDVGGSIRPLVGRQFDVISAFDVLFHVVDNARYRQAIQNFHTLLAPDGFLIMSDFFVRRQARHDRTSNPHCAMRSLSMVEQALAETGFEVVGRWPMFVLMNYPVNSRSRLRQRLWQIVTHAACLTEATGFLWGALLYPIERACLACFRASASTQVMVCRRIVAQDKPAS